MRHVTRPLQHLAPGERVVVGDPSRPRFGSPTTTRSCLWEGSGRSVWSVTGREGEFVDLASADGETMRVFGRTRQQFFEGDALDSYGHSIKWRSDLGRPRLEVVWTDRLPACDDATALAYAETLMAVSERHQENAIVLHVAESDGKRVWADLCFYAAEAEGRSGDETDEFGEGFSGEIVGNAAFWSRRLDVALPEGFAAAAGDLFVAPRFASAHSDGNDLVTVEAPVRLGNFADRAAVGAFLPRSACGDGNGFGWKGFGPATDSDVSHEIDVGFARSQPDEALVLVTPCTWRKGDTVANCLGHTGYTFMMADSVDDYLHDFGLGPGLWVAKDAKWWGYTSHEGDHDSGIDMDFFPATTEDAERFGYTPETLDAEIAGLAEVDPEPGLGERSMADARAAREAEAERAVALRP